ncbi:hypothetical protein O4H66_10315 [Comamonadaceae bacterium G21597-S1]|nr:hypothetical protein [Comamonadaceae bacterium G21597-S1]
MIDRRVFTKAGIALASTGLVKYSDCRASASDAAGLATPVLHVGPSRETRTLADAARIARPGTTIEVDPGNYHADVAVWLHDNVTLRAPRGRARLVAHGAAAEGKGIWVVRANGMRVEGFDFEGCRVPSRNGAGIRLDRGSLHVKDCSFRFNEMGLLTNNDPGTSLMVEDCEFAHNLRPDGHNHNLYAGQIARLTVVGSYFHHAHVGHLLKSRARMNRIFYNRLIDEPGGTASYELEFPNGGVAHVVGNLIGQNPETENAHLISFGAEGLKWPRNELQLIHNTLLNPLATGGVYLRVAGGADTIVARNNLLLGTGTLESAGAGDYRNNLHAQAQDFAQADAFDLRLRSDSELIGKLMPLADATEAEMTPDREYVHPRSTRAFRGTPHNPGAQQSTVSAPTR